MMGALSTLLLSGVCRAPSILEDRADELVMEGRKKGGVTFMDVVNRPGGSKRTVVSLRRQDLGAESGTPSSSVVDEAAPNVSPQCATEQTAVQDLLGLIDSLPAPAVLAAPETKPEPLVADQ